MIDDYIAWHNWLNRECPKHEICFGRKAGSCAATPDSLKFDANFKDTETNSWKNRILRVLDRMN